MAKTQSVYPADADGFFRWMKGIILAKQSAKKNAHGCLQSLWLHAEKFEAMSSWSSSESSQNSPIPFDKIIHRDKAFERPGQCIKQNLESEKNRNKVQTENTMRFPIHCHSFRMTSTSLESQTQPGTTQVVGSFAWSSGSKDLKRNAWCPTVLGCVFQFTDIA